MKLIELDIELDETEPEKVSLTYFSPTQLMLVRLNDAQYVSANPRVILTLGEGVCFETLDTGLYEGFVDYGANPPMNIPDNWPPADYTEIVINAPVSGYDLAQAIKMSDLITSAPRSAGRPNKVAKTVSKSITLPPYLWDFAAELSQKSGERGTYAPGIRLALEKLMRGEGK